MLGGLACSVRVHLDPFVQAAGEHHATDLKTGSGRSKSAAPWHHGRLQEVGMLLTVGIERG